jgi:hypothetical protein
MLLFAWWLLEQAVWIAPLAAVVLYGSIPRRSRPSWGPGVVGALVVLFVLNALGVYPGSPRVSCTVDSGCERTAGTARVGTEFRHGPSITPLPIAEPSHSRGGLGRVGVGSPAQGASPPTQVSGLFVSQPGHTPRRAWGLPDIPRSPRSHSVGAGLRNSTVPTAEPQRSRLARSGVEGQPSPMGESATPSTPPPAGTAAAEWTPANTPADAEPPEHDTASAGVMTSGGAW